MKTLILKSDRSEFETFFIEHMQTKNVDTFPIYRVRSGFGWYLAVLWIEKLNLPGGQFFYGRWKKKIKEYDMVIVFDRILNWNIFEWLHKHNAGIRCIAWYWNPIRNEKRWKFPQKYRDFCEVWSFDQLDCNRFGFKKNIQFYFKDLAEKKLDTKQYDAFFVGMDKGRYDKVSNMVSKLNGAGKKVFCGVVADKNSLPGKEYISQMDYEDIIQLIQKSDCIVDVPQKNQEGITLRVLEALFWHKKLITTNIKIKEYDFYRPENILIWENPDNETIIDFFSSEYIPVDENTIDKYSFEGWLKAFTISEKL